MKRSSIKLLKNPSEKSDFMPVKVKIIANPEYHKVSSDEEVKQVVVSAQEENKTE